MLPAAYMMIFDILKRRTNDNYQYSSAPWITGVWRRLPWTGILALLITIAASIAVG